MLWSEREEARARLDAACAELREHGIEAEGVLGDADPIVAVQEVWDPGRFDEIVVSTFATGASRWMQIDLPHRVAKLTDCTVRHVESRPAADAGADGAAARAAAGCSSRRSGCCARARAARRLSRGARLRGTSRASATIAAARVSAAGHRLAAGDALADDVRGDVEVAREAVERELARLEDLRQPRDLLLERDVLARVEDGPVDEVLVVVHGTTPARPSP